MLRKFAPKKYFLWNYIVDFKYQNQGLGTKAILELCNFLKHNYNCTLLTTTYTSNNKIAKKFYENMGFVETEIINDGKIKEVNMELNLK